jgi:phosphoglycolate phosphatase
MAESGAERARTLVVGDSGVDVRTARNAGVPVYGVTYGFAPESFETDPPDRRFDSMGALADCVLGG